MVVLRDSIRFIHSFRREKGFPKKEYTLIFDTTRLISRFCEKKTGTRKKERKAARGDIIDRLMEQERSTEQGGKDRRDSVRGEKREVIDSEGIWKKESDCPQPEVTKSRKEIIKRERGKRREVEPSIPDVTA